MAHQTERRGLWSGAGHLYPALWARAKHRGAPSKGNVSPGKAQSIFPSPAEATDSDLPMLSAGT